MNFIIMVFGVEWKMQKGLMRLHKKHYLFIKKIHWASWILLFIAGASWILTARENVMLERTTFVFTLLFFFANFITKSINALSTVRGFFSTGILTICILFLMAMFLINKFSPRIADTLSYVVICIVLTLLWVLFSSMCNSKVATLSNGILTVIFGLLISIKDVIIKLSIQNEYNSFIDKGFTVFLFPFCLMLAVATLTCLVKQYWINKYNNGNDINENLDVDKETS